MSKYRIKINHYHYHNFHCISYVVQVKACMFWVTVKTFYDPNDTDFAKRQAEELLDKLLEK